MNSIDILTDAASRPAEAIAQLRDQLTPALLDAHPGGHDNSIAWLLWHVGREIDVQVASMSGREEVWRASGLRERFDLGEAGDGIGYGMDAEQARSIRVEDPDLLIEYVQQATGALVEYIRTLSDEDLEDVVDEEWDPPVTRGVRIVSIIDDAAQHAGQAAYAAGMAAAQG
ncbi:DinB family protein [Brachybacterium sp. JHP9]|uniref:DinB family protein n=1 Tax=Brachybacterium equifaecis TaxID=2910770 RepID=A0ABT0QZX2_9MICO|nr:DinB family protein [Brachybacterium equifaecis]MCL6423209.1 DinB family protein [Brachybacterium equifaecis]